jgi:hypothetical protein
MYRYPPNAGPRLEYLQDNRAQRNHPSGRNWTFGKDGTSLLLLHFASQHSYLREVRQSRPYRALKSVKPWPRLTWPSNNSPREGLVPRYEFEVKVAGTVRVRAADEIEARKVVPAVLVRRQHS